MFSVQLTVSIDNTCAVSDATVDNWILRDSAGNEYSTVTLAQGTQVVLFNFEDKVLTIPAGTTKQLHVIGDTSEYVTV